MKNKFSFVISLWWVLLLGVLGGMIIWLAPKEERVSEMENRNLAGAPELSVENILDASYMSGVENFLADGFFKRINLIEISANLKGVFNIKTEEELLDNNMEEAVSEFMEEAEEINMEAGETDSQAEDDSEAKDEAEDNNSEEETTPVNTGKEYTYWLEFTNGGTKTVYTYPVENLQTSIDALNAYRGTLPEDGELHFFQIPYGYLANQLIYDDNDKYSGWGCDAEDYLAEHADQGVYIHNGPEILEEHLLDGELCYFRTDYHWSALGAYYGHEGIMQDMGVPYLDFDDYDYKVYENYIGVGYGSNPSAEIRAKADKLELLYPLYPMESYVISHLTEHEEAPVIYHNLVTYRALMGGTLGPWRQLKTGANTGSNCLIITDSFGNAFAPYMFPYYDEVHMLDLRPAYWTRSAAGATVREYITEYGIDDIYVMLSTSSSMNSGYMLNYLMKYLDE